MYALDYLLVWLWLVYVEMRFSRRFAPSLRFRASPIGGTVSLRAYASHSRRDSLSVAEDVLDSLPPLPTRSISVDEESYMELPDVPPPPPQPRTASRTARQNVQPENAPRESEPLPPPSLQSTQKSAFECNNCGKKFASETSVEQHSAHCQIKGNWQVDEPQAIAPEAERDTLPGTSATGSSEFPCELCSRGFDTEAQLLLHLEVRHPTGEVDPDDHVLTEEQFAARLDTESNIAVFCDLCPSKHRVFMSEVALYNHIVQKHKDVCPSDKVLHMLRNPDNFNVFMCDVCKAGFRTEQMLAQHRLDQHEDPDGLSGLSKVYCCALCDDKAFPSLRRLYSHCTSSHAVQIPKARCPVCYKVSDYFGMVEHVALQHPGTDLEEYEIRGVPCPKCDRQFINDAHLHIHLEKHDRQVGEQSQEASGIGPVGEIVRLGRDRFACGSCNKTFRSEASALDHIRAAHPEHSKYPQPDNKSVRKGSVSRGQPADDDMLRAIVDEELM